MRSINFLLTYLLTSSKVKVIGQNLRSQDGKCLFSAMDARYKVKQADHA